MEIGIFYESGESLMEGDNLRVVICEKSSNRDTVVHEGKVIWVPKKGCYCIARDLSNDFGHSIIPLSSYGPACRFQKLKKC
jgi:hypothetical protein